MSNNVNELLKIYNASSSNNDPLILEKILNDDL